jgi:hypothetical protein
VTRPQLLPLSRLDSVDSLHTDRDSTTINRESPSKVSCFRVSCDSCPGFYYDKFDGETSFAAAWQENEDAKRALDAAEKEATKKVSIFAVKNKQSPNQVFIFFSSRNLKRVFQVQNRILGNIAGERLAYEACEIYMNETAPNELSADEIRAEIFEVVKKAITADE